MRVMTWNYSAAMRDGGDVRSRVVGVCRRIDADICLLQEVDYKTHRWFPWIISGPNQPLILKQALGMHAIFGACFRYKGGYVGNAILSRWPVLDWWVYQYPLKKVRRSMDANPTNSHLWARIDHPHRPLHALSVHYSIGGEENTQWENDTANSVTDARMVNRILDERAPGRDAVILGGDFNQGGPDIVCRNNPQARFCEDVDVTRGRILQTHDEARDKFGAGIDHVYASTTVGGSRPGFRATSVRYDAPSNAVSEHAAIVCEMEFEGPPEPTECRQMRARVTAIHREIDELRRRMKGLTPKHRDYWDTRRWVEAQIAQKNEELGSLNDRASRIGCEALSGQPSLGPWTG